MGFIIKSSIETFEETEVMSISILAFFGGNQGFDFGILVTHFDFENGFDFDISPFLKQGMRAMAKSPLGRGLSALLSGNTSADAELLSPKKASPSTKASSNLAPISFAVEVAMDQIQPCSFQPRKAFDEDSLKDLATSIRSQGIVQPLIVRPRGDAFELIAGERRWRAAQLAGLVKVPVLIRNVSNREGLELALVENLQRENLNPIEEALGYQQLMDQFELRQDEVAKKVGKNRASITNALRLLKLPASVQSLLKKRQISVGHAKVILSISGDARRSSIADRVVKAHLSVRETEALINKTLQKQRHLSPKARVRDANLLRIEERIRQRFRTKVSLKYNRGKGSVEMQFFTDEDFERLIELLGITAD